MDALGVVGVVHRVGLRHALDEAELELVAAGQAELLELAHAELDEVVVVHLPHLVAGEAEELEPDAGLGRVRDHPGAPGAEVLDAADLHVRVVDVDPVVREQVLAVEHHGDREEVAVAQAPAAAITSGCGCGLGHADRVPQRQRRDDRRRLEDLLAGTCTRTQRSPSNSSFVTRWFEQHLAAELARCRRSSAPTSGRGRSAGS